ncbi:MAG: hypothetical protein ACYC0J_03235 [Gammaproteobacteria bacterium]
MFRNKPEVIQAPKADREYLEWLRQHNTAPTALELIDEEPEEADESEATSSSDESDLDESSEDGQESEATDSSEDSDLKELGPPRKKEFRGRR